MNEINYEKTLFVPSPHTYLGEYISDLPDNVYLNKTTTGCGCTHLALTNNTNYVVLVPYKSAIKNKTSGEKGIKGVIKVMGGIKRDSIKKSIEQHPKNKPIKIMTTYDSFYKVYDTLLELNRVKDFKLCIDEAHILVTLAKIKGKHFKFLYKHYKEFKSFVFVTATPNDKSLLPKAIKDVEFVRVIWEVSEKVHITEKHVKDSKECNKYVVEICKQHLLGEVDGNAYIFYNSVSEIINVIKKLKNMDDFTEDNVNIFCAENPNNDRKVSFSLGRGYVEGSFDDNKRINFLTSANYESCDILDPEGHTYIIVSSKRNSTALTNHLAVPQACGRLRKSKYKNEAKMIVCGFNDDIYQKKMDEFEKSLDSKETTAKHLIERAMLSKEQGFIEAYEKDIDSFADNPFIIVNDDGTLDFNDEARLAEMQVYRAFHSLIETIPNREIANTLRTVDNDMISVSDEARLLVDEKVDFSRLMKKYIQAIEDDDTGLVEMIEHKSEEHRQLVEVLGIPKIKSIGFNKTKLMNAYRLAVKFSENNLLIKSKLTGIKVGEKYTSYVIVDTLQKAYDSTGISRKAVSYDILNYFSAKKTQVVGEDGKRKQGYLILDDLYKEDYL